MTFVIWLILEFDGIGMISSVNQMTAILLPLAVWMIGGFYVLLKMKKRNGEGAFYKADPLTENDCLIMFFAFMGGIAMAAGNYLYSDLAPLFVREFMSGHVLYTLRNILYYPVEVLLMLELLICSQKAGELFTKKSKIPYGAIALYVLWGLPHILYHGFADGIVSALRAFIYCIPFYASNRNLKTSYISMLILWLL